MMQHHEISEEPTIVVYTRDKQVGAVKLQYIQACAFVIQNDLTYHEILHEGSLWFFFCGPQRMC